jgi:hypothetical protein
MTARHCQWHRWNTPLPVASLLKYVISSGRLSFFYWCFFNITKKVKKKKRDLVLNFNTFIDQFCIFMLAHFIQQSKNQNLKTKISYIIILHVICFIYKTKLGDRERERWKKEEINIKIWSSQFQTIIILDRKLWLRHSTRSQKFYDDIYIINNLCHYSHF